MDPNFFHVNLERAFEVFVAIVLLSLFVERTLALLFETRFVMDRLDRKGLKVVIAYVVSVFLCWFWQFDAVSMIILRETVTCPGYLITGGVIAGGSKASIKLFHDFLGIYSRAYAERHELTKDKSKKKPGTT